MSLPDVLYGTSWNMAASGPDRVKTRNDTNSDDTCSRNEVRIIECGMWNINFIKEDVVKSPVGCTRAYACIAFMTVSDPSSLMTRFMLYASTCKLISVLTRSIVRVKKCVAPIQALIVPNGCSTVCLRIRIISGL